MSLPFVTHSVPISYDEIHIRLEPLTGYTLPEAGDKPTSRCFSVRNLTVYVNAERQQSDMLSDPVNWGQRLTAWLAIVCSGEPNMKVTTVCQTFTCECLGLTKFRLQLVAWTRHQRIPMSSALQHTRFDPSRTVGDLIVGNVLQQRRIHRCRV